MDKNSSSDSLPETIRAFIAFDIGDEIRRQITDLTERLEKGFVFTGADPKWAGLEGIHLTLKFLGNISREKLPEIENAMIAATSDCPPVVFSARGLGVFPDERRPRVLWVGIKRGAEEICELQQRLDDALIRLGFLPEEREFHPHLTLARFKSSRGARGMAQVIKSHARFFCGEAAADRLTLYRSELHPSGARYTVLVEAPLRGIRSIEAETKAEDTEAT
ncbi:MAG: RNA 2',3'-cyclic phosphodiesterase [Candidatus Sumerlaeota bacterium]|nr:RNA 2',3'-cyclic phosphodiesterase [Candidatus Sumerlaeota bacterium]